MQKRSSLGWDADRDRGEDVSELAQSFADLADEVERLKAKNAHLWSAYESATSEVERLREELKGAEVLLGVNETQANDIIRLRRELEHVRAERDRLFEANR